MPIYALGELTPRIHASAFVHPDAVIIGDVTLGAESSVWPSAVLRGDSARIVVGDQTSIQDGAIIHVATDLPTLIGSRCVVAHNAHIEGAVIEDDVLIGSGSVVLHHVHVHSRGLVAAGAVVLEKTVVPANGLAAGVPAKIRENAIPDGAFDWNVQMYIENARNYPGLLRRLD